MADATSVLYICVGVFYLGAAVALFGFNVGDRLNRVFSLYLVLEGGAMLALTVPAETSWQAGLRALSQYLTLGAPFALVYLAACYRDRFGRPGLRRIAFLVLTPLAFLTELLHLLDHTLFFGSGARPLRPFHYVVTILGPTLLAVLLARDALTTPHPERRRYLLGASLAFAFYPTAFALHLFIPDLMTVRPLELAAALAALAPVGYLLWPLATIAVRPHASALRHSARKYIVIFTLAPVSVAALALARANQALDDAQTLMRFIMTGWLVVLGALVAYAVLRHELFGIEVGLKRTIRRAFVPLLITLVFFVAGRLLEWSMDLGGARAWWTAGALCVGLVIAYRPLQRLADRFADTAMPQVTESKDYEAFRKLQMYEAALAAAWEDGKMEAAEMHRLDRLRERLNISVVDARTLEEEFVRTGRFGVAARRPAGV